MNEKLSYRQILVAVLTYLKETDPGAIFLDLDKEEQDQVIEDALEYMQ